MGGATRWGARGVAAAILTSVPVAMAGLAPTLGPAHDGGPVRVQLSSAGVALPTSTSRRPDTPRPQAVAAPVTIAGGLTLRTRSERHRRIAVSSSKGSRIWTASALSSHD